MKKRKNDEFKQSQKNNQIIEVCKGSPAKRAEFSSNRMSSTSTPYSQPELIQFSSFYGRKYRQQYSKKFGQSNQSSTHCSINNKSKSYKAKEKVHIPQRHKKQKQESLNNFHSVKSASVKKKKKISQKSKQSQESALSEGQILNLLNSYATKIQRQWRMYWFRKCYRFIRHKERQKQEYLLIKDYVLSTSLQKQQQSFEEKPKPHNEGLFTNSNAQKSSNRQCNPKRQEYLVSPRSRASLSQLDIENPSSNNNLSSRHFNKQKYVDLQSADSQKKEFERRLFNNATLSNNQNSFEQKHSVRGRKSYKQKVIQCDGSTDSMDMSDRVKSCGVGSCSSLQGKELCTPVNKLKTNEASSASKGSDQQKLKQFYSLEEKKNKIKLSQAIVQVKVGDQERDQETRKKTDALLMENNHTEKAQRKSKKESHDRFEQKYPLSNFFTKCKGALQVKRQKTQQQIQSRFANKQITQRTYTQLLHEANENHCSRAKTLELKEGSIKNSWKELYLMFKDFKENSFVEEDSNKLMNNCDESSIYLDRWDFEATGKKSVSHLESFEEFARELNEKNEFSGRPKDFSSKTIELVLDELDRIEESQAATTHMVGGQTNQNPQDSNQQGLISPKQIASQGFAKKEKRQFDSSENCFEFTVAEREQRSTSLLCSPRKQPDQEPLYRKISDQIQQREDRLLFEEAFGSKAEKNRQVLIEDQEGVSEVEIKLVASKQRSIQFEEKFSKSPESKDDEEDFNDSILKEMQTVQNNKKETEQEEHLRQQSLKVESRSIIYRIACDFLAFHTNRTVLQHCEQIQTAYICFKKSQLKKQEIKQELQKYVSIDPSIDTVNSWLLEVSHFILDHHNAEVTESLVEVRQLPAQQQFAISKDKSRAYTFFQDHFYLTISERIFKEFEFFYIKNVFNQMQIDSSKYDVFSNLTYTFHRCLIDCMNQTLLDELTIGRKWVVMPWINTFRSRKREVEEHAKQCLERAINRVSNWAEYGMAQLPENLQMEVNPSQWKQYQDEKMSLIVKEEVLEFPIESEFVLSNLICELSERIYDSELQFFISEVTALREQRNNN